MAMALPYPPPSQFLHCPLLGNPLCFTKTRKSNSDKFPGCASLHSTPLTPSFPKTLAENNDTNRKKLSTGEFSHSVDSKGGSFIDSREELAFSNMIMFHCMKNEVDDAKSVLDHMVSNGLTPDSATFTLLINSFCKRGQLQKAFRVLETMKRIGCRPSVQIYNCLLQGMCYVGRVEEAFELLLDIKKSSMEPDIYIYTAMMDGFCKVGRSNEAMELLHEAVGKGLSPNVVTFNTLLNGYNKEGRPVEGMAVLKQMKKINCLPDHITFSTLLNGLLIWGEIDGALRIYKEMVGSGFEVGENLMNRLLRGLCRKLMRENGPLDGALEVFEEVRRRVLVIHRGTYAMLIQALCTGRRGDDALGILHQMFRSGYAPRVVTMNNVIGAFCVQGNVDKAILVLVLMYENRKFPNRVSYDLLIHELNRQGRFSCAANVYAAALVRGLVPHKKPQYK